jgi:hypothetical protein
MNARQKAKYYKRKYKELSFMLISKSIIESRKIDTLKFKKYYPKEDAIISSEYIKHTAKSDFVDYIASRIDDYAVFEEHFDEISNNFYVTGKIDIVCPFK